MRTFPGVQDEGHIALVASSIHRAAHTLTTCTPTIGEDGEEKACRPLWVWGRTELVAALLTMGYWESRFLRRIGDGQCRKWECDAYKLPDGRIAHRARGFYQVQLTGGIDLAEWKGMLGATSEQAQYTAALVSGRMLARHRHRCKTREGMIAGYARGNVCVWNRAGNRVLFMGRTHAKLTAPPPSES